MKKVFVETKFFKDGQHAGFWSDCYEGWAIEETDNRVLVETGKFWKKREWLPKNGIYVRVKEIKNINCLQL